MIPSEFVTPLDTIEFDQLVDLARGEIPRYAPDWTDHNVHDPGMTLVDLLAWIVDQQVYRAGHVGGRHLRAFAALLGRRAEGPAPARGIVWPAQGVAEGRLLQPSTDVRCEAHPALRVVTERQVYLTPAALVGVDLTVGGVPVPAPAPDGVTWTVDGAGPGTIHTETATATALTLRFDEAPGMAGTTAPIALGLEVAAPPGPPPSPETSWGPAVWEYRAAGDGWEHLPVDHDGTAGLARTGVVVLTVPPARPGTAEVRLRLDRGFFPVAPQVRAVAVNALPVVQLEHVARAALTVGTGLPDQVVELSTADLVPAPGGPRLTIEVGGEPWTEHDLATSGPDDPHYAVSPDAVVFGNGVNGRRPPAGAAIAHGDLLRTAGSGGNLRPGLTWGVPVLGPAPYGANRHALAGGRDATTATELLAQARAAATSRAALLTDDDLAAAAYALPGMAVGRAEVLPRFDRRLPGRSVDGVRTLVVAPAGFGVGPGGSAEVPRAYLREVSARLGGGRVLGERLVVQGPAVVVVDVAVRVTSQAWAVPSDVAAAVEGALRDRLTAVRRSAEPWPLGRDLTVTDVVAIVASVEGVGTVPDVRLAGDGSAGSSASADDASSGLTVPRDGVVVAGDVEVVVDGGAPGAEPSWRRWD
ncbi:hypothetical protein [Georgenia muralis]|uniref:Putative phage baseplate assembly protein n=1 Tax=Georgenia muralis TaxID=154117 RepID=A0A3N4Z6F2_9MICO|nr:hypothetical protein [Georgenia muralis]RPF28989.1 putative phage baseplate assembly protein [Georgenia muralis]